MRRSRYVVVYADIHGGHIVGLTPPKWFKRSSKSLVKYESRLWREHKGLVKDLPKIDHMIINGDVVDGKQPKNKGGELITPVIAEQCQIAVASIIMPEARTIDVVRGTRYHVGTSDNYEDQILPLLNKEGYKDRELGITDHGYYEIGGVVIDVKHKIGNAQLPHTKGTPLGREKLQNLLWHEHGEVPLAKIIVRSHVHNYHRLSGWNGRVGEWHSFTTPALQGLGGSYGVRECSQTIDWGVVLIEITPKGNVNIEPLIRLTREPDEMVKKLEV